MSDSHTTDDSLQNSLLDALLSNGVLEAVDTHFAAMLGRRTGCTDPVALLAAALALRAPRHGHVCLDFDAVGQTLRAPDGSTPTLPPAAALRDAALRAPFVVEEASSTSSTSGDEAAPLILRGNRLYLRRMVDHEAALAEALAKRLALPPTPDDGTLEAQILRRLPDSPGQRAAVALAATRRLAIITGGPGTGKTTTVRSLLGVLLERAEGKPPLRIRLLAPTGKAAARLAEAVSSVSSASVVPDDAARLSAMDAEAMTIHRAIGAGRRGPPRHDAANPMPADLVIVDECSMVDLALMRRLFDATPLGASMVLLGDPDQLASVEAGTVLADLVGLPGAHAALTHSYRFGGEVSTLANAIRAGDADAVIDLLQQPPADDAPRWIDAQNPFDALSALREVVEPALQAMLAAAQAIDAAPETDRAARIDEALSYLGRQRVLSAHRRGLLGVGHLNGELTRWLVGRRRDDDPWFVGRPVLVTENDYRMALYNGDAGLVVPTSPAGAPEASFAVAFPSTNEPRLVSASRLPAHETVMAMTIHKSQGSECDHAVVVLPSDTSRVATRELLYTGVTRARSTVTLVASEAAIRAAVTRQVVRASALRERIAALQSSP